MKPFKKAIMMLGVCFIVSGWLISLWTFYGAFLEPSKRITVDINFYGEAVIEFILFAFLLPCAIYVIIQSFKLFKNDIIVAYEVTPQKSGGVNSGLDTPTRNYHAPQQTK